MEKEIINKVALSGIITMNLEEFYPQGERVLFDIKEHLLQGLILKEKDFREYVKNEDWSTYTDKYVALTCSVDEIISAALNFINKIGLIEHLSPNRSNGLASMIKQMKLDAIAYKQVKV